jgi:hypothetical protein
MLMDIFSAIVVIVPLIMGIALHFGINPYHLGIVFLMNLEIGYLMPPMGLNLFIAGFRFGRPVPQLYRVVVPFILIFVAALLITTYVPQLSLAFIPGARATTHRVRHEHEHRENGAPTTPQGGSDCEVPREGETFEDFDRRCSGADTGGGAEPSQQDCEVPREGESFEDFQSRCAEQPQGSDTGTENEQPGSEPEGAAPPP